MGRNDMNHLRHLETVALSDCAVLESKEATYKGSWKRAGGRSAWFMARRNMDRMITMAAPPDDTDVITIEDINNKLKDSGGEDNDIIILHQSLEYLRNCMLAEDIFNLIAAAPKGEDGTFLACMRDARRYFTLVEAEMIAEGVVRPEAKTYEQEAALTINEWDGQETTEFVITINGKPVEGVTSCIVHSEGGVRRVDIVSRKPSPAHSMDPGPAVGELVPDTPSCGDGSYDSKQQRIAEERSGGGYAAEQAARHPPGPIKESDVVFHDAKELKPGFEKIYAGGLVHEVGRHPRKPTAEERADMERRKQVISDGGSMHALAEVNMLYPWHATQQEYDTMKGRIGAVADLFYTRRAAGVYQLESVVGAHYLPIELSNVYDFSNGSNNKWILRRDKVPAELEDNFPRIQLEMNHKEHDEMNSDFAFMLEFNEGAGKWMLLPQYQAWGRDVG